MTTSSLPKNSSSSPLMYDVLQTDLSKTNRAGVGDVPEITKANQEMLDARDQFAKALEDRYAQPNWFKIAAGFAKPQLGGFMASLGSASEALGENVEQQRAIAPTIAQMRSETAAQRQVLAQKTKAQGLFNRLINNPHEVTPSAIGEISNYDKDLGNIAQDQLTNQNTMFGQLMNSARFVKDISELYAKFPRDLIDNNLTYIKSLIPGSSDKKSTDTSLEGKPNNVPTSPTGETSEKRTPIPGINVNSLPYDLYQQALNTHIEKQTSKYQDLASTTAQQAISGRNVFETTQQIHDLVADPQLKTYFAKFEQGDPAGILGMIAERQKLSDSLAGARDYFIHSDLANKKDALTKVNQFESLMGKLQTDLQNGVINPTDQRTIAEFKSLPKITNTQDAFGRIMRYIGNEGLFKYETQLALQRAKDKENFDPNFFNSHEEFVKVLNNANKRRDLIIKSPLTRDRPAFMQGSIDEAAYKGKDNNKPSSTNATPINRKMTSYELRQLAHN